MHLAVDGVGAKFGGAATVLLDFVQAALADTRVKRLTVFTSPRELRRFDLPISSKLDEIEVKDVDRSRLKRMQWSLYKMGNQCTKLGVDIVLCLGNMGRAPILCVVFIQQSLPFSAEALATLKFRQKAKMVFIKGMMRYSCKEASHILVQTPVMIDNLQSAFGIEDQRLSYIMPSVYLSSQELDQNHPLMDLFNSVPIGQRLLYVGTDSPYKMVHVIIKGITLLRKSMPEVTVFLTLPPDHPYSTVPGVVCCGYLQGAALRSAYEMATLLVMPSLTETVGLPMIEAFSVGTPVIAADRPYAHVICENAAIYFDPHSAESFVAVAEHVLKDAALSLQLSETGLTMTRNRATERPYSRMVDRLVELAAL